MIIKENYSIDHIKDLQESSRRDPNLIKRVLFAFGLLETLRRVGLPFIFKGGKKTSHIFKLKKITDMYIIKDADGGSAK